jgi:aspartyl-tRNA(Asn)/glutamyl-tRNA(Gln) amidotransferase subunit A
MKDEGSNWEPDIKKKFDKTIEFLKGKGAEIIELDFSLLASSIPIYYIIATAECSSNLSRFDGIKYGHRTEGKSKLDDLVH